MGSIDNMFNTQLEFSAMLDKLGETLRGGDYEVQYLPELVRSASDYIFDSDVTEMPEGIPEDASEHLTELKEYVEEHSEHIEEFRQEFDMFIEKIGDPTNMGNNRYYPNNMDGGRRRRRRSGRKARKTKRTKAKRSKSRKSKRSTRKSRK